MKQIQKGNTTLIAIIIVVIAITAGVIGWILAKNSQVPVQQATTITQPPIPIAQTQPVATPAPVVQQQAQTVANEQSASQPLDENTSWQTYQNSNIGYSLKFPSDWKYLVCDNNIQFMLYSPTTKKEKCGEPLFNYALSIIGPGPPPGNINNAATSKKVSINGIDAIKYIGTPVGQIGDTYIDMLVLSNGGKTYTLTLDKYTEYGKILDQILSTFKFTK